MPSENSIQMLSGKSFEYALLKEFSEKLNNKTSITIIENNSYVIAKHCFECLPIKSRSENLLYASCAVNTLIDLEPRLSNTLSKDDVLQLELQKDNEGRKGDVRDLLIIRCLQKWEIGVSAKVNNDAVKHSRLSDVLDFGKEWFNLNCSEKYFNEIKPIFNKLRKLKNDSNGKAKWSEINDKKEVIYTPILNAFEKELQRLFKNNNDIAKELVSYVIGHKDFYKVLKYSGKVQIEAYNFNSTLNLPFKDIKSKCQINKTHFPKTLVNTTHKNTEKMTDPYTTLIVTLDQNWELSFRIHNATTRIEPSLKFDVRITSSPKTLFKITLNVGDCK